jgi:hypothetical protein
VRVDLSSIYSPNKRTQQVLEIAYMIPQKKIDEGHGGGILPIEGVQQYERFFAIHPM